MHLVSKILLAIGVIVIVVAFQMDVALGNASVVNLHMVTERQNFLLLGSVIFISGIILFATSSQRKSIDRSPESLEEEKRPERLVSGFWLPIDLGGKVILASVVLTIMSLFFYWRVTELQGAGDSRLEYSTSRASIEEMLVIFAIWAYPIIVLLLRKTINVVFGALCSVLAIFFCSRNLYEIVHFAEDTSNVIYFSSQLFRPGAGMYIAFLGSVILLFGVFLTYIDEKIPD